MSGPVLVFRNDQIRAGKWAYLEAVLDRLVRVRPEAIAVIEQLAVQALRANAPKNQVPKRPQPVVRSVAKSVITLDANDDRQGA